MTNAKLAFGSVILCGIAAALGALLWLRYPLTKYLGMGGLLLALLLVTVLARKRLLLRAGGLCGIIILLEIALLFSQDLRALPYGMLGFLDARFSQPPLFTRVMPNAPGYDARGWRNAQALDRANIVVFGDSQTWGQNALIAESWTAQLGTLSGQTVYNMALPGYGMAEYALLLPDALALHPHTVLIGLYLGNDLADTYAAVYSRGAYPELRSGETSFDVDAAPWEIDAVPVNGMGVPDTLVAPGYRLNALDVNRPYVAEGLRLTTVLLQATADACAAAGVRCVVVLIPTKETVYNLPLAGDYTTLLANEAQVNAQLAETCARVGLQFVDTTPALQAALAAGERLYPVVNDGHPLPAGYRVIAEVVAAALRLY